MGDWVTARVEQAIQHGDTQKSFEPEENLKTQRALRKAAESAEKRS